MKILDYFWIRTETTENKTSIIFETRNDSLTKLTTAIEEELKSSDVKDQILKQIVSRLSYEVTNLVIDREAKRISNAIETKDYTPDVMAKVNQLISELDMDSLASNIFFHRREDIIKAIDLTAINPQVTALINQKLAEKLFKNWNF